MERAHKVMPILGIFLIRNFPQALGFAKTTCFSGVSSSCLPLSIDSRMTWIRAERFLRQTNDLLA
jgi:hypothetical protein